MTRAVVQRESLYEKKTHEKIMRQLSDITVHLQLLRARQEHLEDALLSAADVKALKAARADLRNNRTSSLASVKKKFGL